MILSNAHIGWLDLNHDRIIIKPSRRDRLVSQEFAVVFPIISLNYADRGKLIEETIACLIQLVELCSALCD